MSVLQSLPYTQYNSKTHPFLRPWSFKGPAMSTITEPLTEQSDQFDWKIQPLAARWVTRALDALTARNPIIAKLAYDLREFTGTRLVDWVDHIALSDNDSLGLI